MTAKETSYFTDKTILYIFGFRRILSVEEHLCHDRTSRLT